MFKVTKANQNHNAYPVSGVPSRFLNTLKAGLALTAIGMTASGPAQARPNHPLTPAKRLEKRITQHRPVRFDPNFEYLWSSPRSKHEFDHITTLPIIGKDQRKDRYFGLVQKGGTLASLQVVELPTGGLRVESTHDSYYHCGASPNHSDVIGLDQNDQPVVTLTYSNGEVFNDVPIGDTHPFVSDGPIIGPPPLPPGYCENR